MIVILTGVVRKTVARLARGEFGHVEHFNHGSLQGRLKLDGQLKAQDFRIAFRDEHIRGLEIQHLIVEVHAPKVLIDIAQTRVRGSDHKPHWERLLNYEIDQFREKHRMPETTFGRLALRDPRLISDLKTGRVPGNNVRRRIFHFIDTYKGTQR